MKNCLTEDGVVITNVLGSFTGKDSEFFLMEYETYNKVFPSVLVYQVAPSIAEDTKQNLILVGSKKEEVALEKIEQYQNLLENQRDITNSTKQYLTDDYAPVE